MLVIAPLSTYNIRAAWRAESYGRHGLPTRLGKTEPADTTENISAARKASKKRRKRTVWQRTRDDKAEPSGCSGCPAQSLDRGSVPAPLDAEATAERSVPCDEPDRGQRGFLHRQGLARTRLDLPAKPQTRTVHRHPAQGRSPASRHPSCPVPAAAGCAARSPMSTSPGGEETPMPAPLMRAHPSRHPPAFPGSSHRNTVGSNPLRPAPPGPAGPIRNSRGRRGQTHRHSGAE